jgi:hypothetical protein
MREMPIWICQKWHPVFTLKVSKYPFEIADLKIAIDQSTLLMVAIGLQIHERIAQEIDPEGAGLSYSDFDSIASRMPDFFDNFKMSV